jgi:hypothetical protein
MLTPEELQRAATELSGAALSLFDQFQFVHVPQRNVVSDDSKSDDFITLPQFVNLLIYVGVLGVCAVCWYKRTNAD